MDEHPLRHHTEGDDAVVGSALQPEIHALIEARDFAALKAIVRDMEMHDLGELLGELDGDDAAIIFRLLPHDQAAGIFGDLPIEQQETLVGLLSTERLADILNHMPADERTELLEELPGELATKLMRSLRKDQLQIARSLLAYPEDSIGRLMTPAYVGVRPDWTVEQVLSHLRKIGPTAETMSVLYVTDEHNKLLDKLTLEQVLLAQPDTPVRDMMDNQFVALRAREDREDAVEIFSKYDATVLPVTTGQGVLVGIVTIDDVLDVAEEEVTEDFQKMVAVEALESPYFATSLPKMIRKRLPWLIMLLVAEMLTVVALASFEKLSIINLAILAIFVPMINSPAGNAGSQMAGLIIRGLAVQEMTPADWLRVLGREVLLGAALGIILGALGFPIALLFNDSCAVAFSVGAAIALAVVCANFLGAMLPFFFKRIGLDPAVTSGPFIASLMDVLAIVIYFSIAALVLGLAG